MYEVRDSVLLVIVVAVGKRERNAVCRMAAKRVWQEALWGTSKNSEFAQMQGAEKILVPANLKVTLH